MKKQIIVALSALALTVLLFVFGKTSIPKSPAAMAARPVGNFNIDSAITAAKENLSPGQLNYVAALENGVKRGDVKAQQVKAYQALATFWGDSARQFFPFAYYNSELAKLDNSEKSLTFAGQIFLDNIRGENDPKIINWETANAVALFEKALELNPNSVEARIGLGSTYIFGSRGESSEKVMQGIQQLLSVVREDSTNMRAQLMLGIGGTVSGQYDKAIERLLKVVHAQPNNLEAIAFLADSYAAIGNKEQAIHWYNQSKKMVNDKHYTAEVDKRLKQLQGQ